MPLESELAQNAIQSNLVIQQTLTEQVSKLQAQLKELEQLTDTVNKAVTTETIPEEAFESEIQIPGAKRVTSLIPSFELLLPTSPFYAEASKRAHYERWTTPHPINPEVLADAVKKENMRLEAYRELQSPSAPSIDLETNVEGIDWVIVAEKVTDNSQIKRTPEECRIQWLGTLRPTINKDEWTQQEVDQLHQLIATTMANGEKINWVQVAKDLGTNRIPLECMKRATTRPRHHWDTVSDEKLLEGVKKYGTNNWNLVAKHVSEFVTTAQCQMRYFRSVDPTIKRGLWSSEEDNRLRKAFEAYGTSWIDVSSVMYGRTNDQCRERWTEIGTGDGGKGAWSIEEDKRLLDAVEELGHNWKNVCVKVGGGRTSTNCRLRYGRIKSRKQTQTASESSETPEPMMTLNTVASMSTPAAPIPSLKATTTRRIRKPKKTVPEIEVITSNTTTNDESPTIAEIEATPRLSKPRPKPRATRKVDKGKEKAVETLIESSSMNIVDGNSNSGHSTELAGPSSITQTPTSFNTASVTFESHLLESSQPRIPIPGVEREIIIGKRTRYMNENNSEEEEGEEEGEEKHQRQMKRQKKNNSNDTSNHNGEVNDNNINMNRENDENVNHNDNSRGSGVRRGRGRGRGGSGGSHPISTGTRNSITPRRSARVASTNNPMTTNPNPNP